MARALGMQRRAFRLHERFFVQPALDALAFCRGIVKRCIEQQRGRDFTAHRFMDLCARIDAREALAQPREHRLAGEVGFGEHQAVGDRRLLHRFGAIVELARAVNAIDQRDHGTGLQPLRNDFLGGERAQHRHRVG